MPERALERKVSHAKGGAARKASVRQAGFERIGEKALAGDIKSMNFLLEHKNENKAVAAAQSSIPPKTALEILRQYFSREQRNKVKE